MKLDVTFKVGEEFGAMLWLQSEMTGMKEEVILEAIIAADFHASLELSPQSIANTVMNNFANKELAVDLVAVFCKHNKPSVLIGMRRNGLQLPLMIREADGTSAVPFTAEQCGNLIAILGSYGYQMVGKEASYYVYEWEEIDDDKKG